MTRPEKITWSITASVEGVLVSARGVDTSDLLAGIRGVLADGKQIIPKISGDWAEFSPALSAGSKILYGEEVIYEVSADN